VKNYTAHSREARRLIQSGALGALKMISGLGRFGTPTAFWNRAQGWRAAPTLGRGYERDLNPIGVASHRAVRPRVGETRWPI